MKPNRKFLEIESITGEGPVVLIPINSPGRPSRKRLSGQYRAVRLKPTKK